MLLATCQILLPVGMKCCQKGLSEEHVKDILSVLDYNFEVSATSTVIIIVMAGKCNSRT